MNDVVKFLVENWYLLIVGVGVAAAAGFMLYHFFQAAYQRTDCQNQGMAAVCGD